jgi:hypothetical protein
MQFAGSNQTNFEMLVLEGSVEAVATQKGGALLNALRALKREAYDGDGLAETILQELLEASAGGRFSRTRMQESMRHSCRPKALSTSRDARTQNKDSAALHITNIFLSMRLLAKVDERAMPMEARRPRFTWSYRKRFPSARKIEEASTRAAVLASALGKFSRKPHLVWMLLNQNRDIVSGYLDSAHDQTSIPSRKCSRSPSLDGIIAH